MGIFGGAPSAPNSEELQAAQEAAARRERDKAALDKAGNEAAAQKQMEEQKQKARVYASTVTEDEENAMKKFLQGL